MWCSLPETSWNWSTVADMFSMCLQRKHMESLPHPWHINEILTGFTHQDCLKGPQEHFCICEKICYHRLYLASNTELSVDVLSDFGGSGNTELLHTWAWKIALDYLFTLFSNTRRLYVQFHYANLNWQFIMLNLDSYVTPVKAEGLYLCVSDDTTYLLVLSSFRNYPLLLALHTQISNWVALWVMCNTFGVSVLTGKVKIWRFHPLQLYRLFPYFPSRWIYVFDFLTQPL